MSNVTSHVAPVLQREAMSYKLRPQDEVTATDQCTVGVDVLTIVTRLRRVVTSSGILLGRHWTVDLSTWLMLSQALFVHLPHPAATLSRSKCTSRLSKYARSCSGSFVMKSARRRSTVLSKTAKSHAEARPASPVAVDVVIYACACDCAQ